MKITALNQMCKDNGICVEILEHDFLCPYEIDEIPKKYKNSDKSINFEDVAHLMTIASKNLKVWITRLICEKGKLEDINEALEKRVDILENLISNMDNTLDIDKFIQENY